jgi:hypothetical protein
MKNTTTIATHNTRNQSATTATIKIIPAIEIVEIGKATNLTLGGNGARHETPSRPNVRWN